MGESSVVIKYGDSFLSTCNGVLGSDCRFVFKTNDDFKILPDLSNFLMVLSFFAAPDVNSPDVTEVAMPIRDAVSRLPPVASGAASPSAELL